MCGAGVVCVLLLPSFLMWFPRPSTSRAFARARWWIEGEPCAACDWQNFGSKKLKAKPSSHDKV